MVKRLSRHAYSDETTKSLHALQEETANQRSSAGNRFLRLLVRIGMLPKPTPFSKGLKRIEAINQYKEEIIRDKHYYEEWLSIEEEHYDAIAAQESIANFAKKTVRGFGHRHTDAITFTVLPPKISAIQNFTVGQKVAIAFLIVALGVAFALNVLNTISIIIAFILLFYIRNIIQTIRFVSFDHVQTNETQIDEDVIQLLQQSPWPRYTILCPLFREVVIVPQFIQAIAALDYPVERLQVLFLTEEKDLETRQSLLSMQLPPHFDVLTVPDGTPQTKPRACNFGLMHATGEYIVIYDAEDIPEPLQLKKAVLTFAKHGADVACVQAKLNFYNSRQNVLTRWFTIEYTQWFDFTLPALQAAHLSIPLGGTSNHFRTALLRKLGAWDPFNVTEDCDLGLRLGLSRMRTVVLESTTMEEANPRPRNWIRQRSRWIKGYLQTYLVHMRDPFRYFTKGRLRELYSLQFIIGGTPATFFINPILWMLLAIYIGFRPLVENLYHVLYPPLTFYPAVFCLIFGNFIFLYIALIACAKRGQYHLMKWTFLLPVYWAMMSVAAVIALVQLITRPHYWEKTQHGLHLQGKPIGEMARR